MIIDIKNSFIQQPDNYKSEENILRIIKAYKLAKSKQALSHSKYQVGNEWRPIYDQFMQNSINTFLTGDVNSINYLFSNFFRLPVSTGLHGLHFDMVEKYMNEDRSILPDDLKIYMDSIVHNLNLLIRNCPNITVDKLKRPNLGNTYGYYVDDHFISVCADYQYYQANKVLTLLKDIQRPKVVELGGGFGGFAYFLLRDRSDLVYMNFDLPEVLALASYYLLASHPDKKFALYGEIELENIDLNDFDAILFPNFEIEKIKENSVHMAFNSYSLAEMEIDAINNYISIFCNISNKFIYHLNHCSGSKLSSDLFPLNYSKFQLIHRSPALWGRHAHGGIIDHHEFIYTT